MTRAVLFAARRSSRSNIRHGVLQLRDEEGLATPDSDRPLSLRRHRSGVPQGAGHGELHSRADRDPASA